MRRILLLVFVFIFVLGLPVFGITLQEAYQNALPGLGYDRLIELDPSHTYTGGLGIIGESVGIKGYGAVIDLQGGSIAVSGSSVIDMDACVVINGSNGLLVQNETTAFITQCSFYGNQKGIKFEGTSGSVTVLNTILAFNTEYGFACDEGSFIDLRYLDAYQNTLENYVKWCSG